MGHVHSTSPIQWDDSPLASPSKDNVSVLAEVAAHIVLDGDYVEKEDDTPILVLPGRMKKRKVMSSTSKDLTEGQHDNKAQGVETLKDFEG